MRRRLKSGCMLIIDCLRYGPFFFFFFSFNSLLAKLSIQRGNAPASSWNDGNTFNVPAASTSAAAIAGLLAGRQAEREVNFDDLPSQTLNSTTASTSGNRKKQSAELRRLLTQRRSLKLLLEDAVRHYSIPVFSFPYVATSYTSLSLTLSLSIRSISQSASPIFKSAPNNFLQSLQVDNPYPIHRGTGPICSICGYWGDILCLRCQERICGLKCATT